MMTLTDLTGLSGIALAASVLVLRWLPLRDPPPGRQHALAALLFIALLLPWGELSAAAYLRALTGDLSMSSLVLLLASSPLLPQAWHARPLSAAHWLAIALTGLLFYLFALGFSPSDSYRLGYGDPLLLAPLFIVALWNAWRGRQLLALCLALAALAWSVGWYESNNLWDYLLDPWLFAYAAGRSLRNAWAVCNDKWRKRTCATG